MTDGRATTNGSGHDDLGARIAGTLHQRAARVVVSDRLESITDGVEPSRLIGTFACEAAVVRIAGRPLTGRRHPAVARVAFAAAAAVVAAALTLALWQRADQGRLDPVTGPTPVDVYPSVDPAAVEAIGVAPAGEVVVQRDPVGHASSALVLGRVDDDRLTDLVSVSIVQSPLPATVTRAIGNRSVRLPYEGDGTDDLIVWMESDALPSEIDHVRTVLDEAEVVRSATYVNQEATWAEFQQLNADRPDVLDLVDPEDLPTSFRVDLGVDDRAVIDPLRAELWALPGVGSVSPDSERYEWDEAGVTIAVDVAPGSDLPIEAVIAALVVTPRPEGGPPDLSVRGRLPDGLTVVAGPAGPDDGPQHSLAVGVVDGSTWSSVIVTRQPYIGPQLVPTRAQVGARNGWLSEQHGEVTVTWPIDDQGWWAQVTTIGLTTDQALALADVVTFTDEATWTARYPAPEDDDPATTTITAPPSTFSTDVSIDSGANTTTTQP